MIRSYAFAALAAVAVLLGVSAYFILRDRGDDRFAECRQGSVAGGSAAIGGPFTLTRHDGVRVTDKEVITGPTLVYFGYTYCPDVCPIDTARNAEAVALLDERGIEVTPVMITIDPARDTPEVMAEYISWMHPRAIGLTGSEEDVAAAAAAYKTYYAKSGSGEDYLMDHLTYTYLMAPEVGFLDFFGRDASAEAMAERTACFAGKL